MPDKVKVDRTSAQEIAAQRARSEDAGAGATAQLNKFDINLASSQFLGELGFSATVVAALRAGRPFFTLEDAGAAATFKPAEASRLKRWFTVTPLAIPDGAGGGATVTLTPVNDEWLVREAPPATEALVSRAVQRRYRRVKQAPARSDAEGKPRHTFPAFRDQHGALRYLDPQYVVIQARCSVDDRTLQDLLQALNLQVHHQLPLRGLFVARLGGARHGPAALLSALLALQGSPLVEVAEPAWLGFDDIAPASATVIALAARAAGDTESDVTLWNLTMLKVARLWQLGMGKPAITLACVDTGADSAHPALQVPPGDAAARAYLDFSGDGAGDDDDGHGTSVAGLMVGRGDTAPYGLAPACSLISLKVLLQTDVSSYASRRAALMHLAARAAAGQKLVVNLSWKTDGDVAIVRTAIDALSQAGALIICSAGNDGNLQGAPHYPSDYPQTLSVAAVDQSGQRASYSNFGPAVDLMAPGGSAAAPLVCCAAGGGKVGRIGTSFAAPQIAAAAALVWSLKPSLTSAQVRAMLAASSGAGVGVPDLGRLVDLLGANTPPNGAYGEPAGPGAPNTPAPPPTPPHCAGAPNWPLRGSVIAAAAGPCQLRAITLRILAARATLSGWDEVAGLLGMDAAQLACMRARLEGTG